MRWMCFCVAPLPKPHRSAASPAHEPRHRRLNLLPVQSRQAHGGDSAASAHDAISQNVVEREPSLADVVLKMHVGYRAGFEFIQIGQCQVMGTDQSTEPAPAYQ